MGANQSSVSLPTSPTSGLGGGGGGGGGGGTSSQLESPELILEVWSPKGQSQKVRQSSVLCIIIIILL